VVGEFFAVSDGFADGFFWMGYGGVELEVKFFFHGADDEKSNPAGEYDAVWGDADKYFGPVGNFGEYFIKGEDEFGGAAFEKAVEADARAIMPVVFPGQFAVTFRAGPAHVGFSNISAKMMPQQIWRFDGCT